MKKKHVTRHQTPELNGKLHEAFIRKFPKNFLLVWILLAFLSSTSALKAQTCTPGCVNGSLIISTGYDHSLPGYISPLALEQNWKLTAVPNNTSPTLVPYGPVWVINANPSWNSFPNAQWLSPLPTSFYAINNIPQAQYGAFEFENCFCLCQPSTVNINFELMCDDGVYVYVDNTLIGTAMVGWHFLFPNRLIVNQNLNLSAGPHCLRVQLFNGGSYAMGFAVEGTITGANLLSATCCHPEGSICGTKLKDRDCDGHADPGDPTTWVAGWPIMLYDGSNNLIATTYTDGYGNYCFPNLPAGNYIVGEGSQLGWTQTYPPSSTYNISLSPGESEMANFYNCPPVLPCNLIPKFNVQVNQCGAVFTTNLPTLPYGVQVVSTHWTFGDGQTSNELNPTHYYPGPGVYTACLYVTLFDGDQCCTVKFCRDVKITTPCPGNCELVGNIGVNFDQVHCQYNFTGNVVFAGLPVNTWYWDFGDGTTGNGSTISHHFPGPGTYTVCLYLFSGTGSQCCFTKICQDIFVDCGCEPDDGTLRSLQSGDNGNHQGTGNIPSNVSLSDGNAIVLNQNVPNPFAESTVITYDIKQDFGKAQIIFSGLNGQVVRTFDIRDKGFGRLNVFANDLSSGIYTYTLVVDGQIIDSKKMEKQ